MEREPEGDAQGAGKLLPFSSTPVGERRGFPGVGQVGRLPPIHRIAEHAAAGRALLPKRDSLVQHALIGAVCLAIWSILWLLIVFAVVSPLGRTLSHQPRGNSDAASVVVRQTKTPAHLATQNFAVRVQPLRNSARLADAAPSCQAGLIAVDGRCVLGEEIQVRPPPGWHRR